MLDRFCFFFFVILSSPIYLNCNLWTWLIICKVPVKLKKKVSIGELTCGSNKCTVHSHQIPLQGWFLKLTVKLTPMALSAGTVCLALCSDVTGSQHQSVRFEPFSLRRYRCLWSYLPKLASICFSKVGFHAICDCSEYKRAMRFQSGWAKSLILSGSSGFSLRVIKLWQSLRGRWTKRREHRCWWRFTIAVLTPWCLSIFTNPNLYPFKMMLK